MTKRKQILDMLFLEMGTRVSEAHNYDHSDNYLYIRRSMQGSLPCLWVGVKKWVEGRYDAS